MFGGSGMLGRSVCHGLHDAGARVGFTYHLGKDEADRMLSDHAGMLGWELDLETGRGIAGVVDAAAKALGGLTPSSTVPPSVSRGAGRIPCRSFHTRTRSLSTNGIE